MFNCSSLILDLSSYLDLLIQDACEITQTKLNKQNKTKVNKDLK